MAIDRVGTRNSQVAACTAAADIYHLDPADARAIIHAQIDTIRTNWDEVCDLARMSSVARKQLWGSAILNPYATYGYQS